MYLYWPETLLRLPLTNLTSCGLRLSLFSPNLKNNILPKSHIYNVFSFINYFSAALALSLYLCSWITIGIPFMCLWNCGELTLIWHVLPYLISISILQYWIRNEMNNFEGTTIENHWFLNENFIINPLWTKFFFSSFFGT